MSISGHEPLPGGWTAACLPDLINQEGVLTDGDWVETEDQDPNGNVRLTQLADVGDGVFRNRSNRFMTSAKAAELRCTFLQPDDVLIARMPDPLGRACTFPGDPRPSVSVVDVCIVRPATEHLSNRWLMNFINAPDFRAAVARFQSGSTRKRISKANLCRIPLPVPPLREQHRIVEAIESYFTRLDDAVATLERVQRNLKRYRASVLKAAVEGRLVPTEAELSRAEGRDYEPASVLLERILAERRRRWQEAGGRGKYQEPVVPDTADLPKLQEGWCWVSLEQLLREPLINGRSVPDATRGFPVLRLTALKGDQIDLAERKTGRWSADEARAFLVSRGDFLVARGNGSIRLVGRGGLVTIDPDPVAFPDTLIRVRVDAAHFSPRLLAALWNSPLVRLHIERRAKTTAGIHKVNQTDLELTPLPLPPRAEQERLLAELDRCFSVGDETFGTIETQGRRCARLRQSILKWAFEGKLADQDPSDEPASVLLERIRTETAARMASAACGASPKRRGRRSTMTGTQHTIG